MDNNIKTLINCGGILAIIIILMFVMKAYSLAGVSVYDACKGFQSCDLQNIQQPAPVLKDEIIWTQEMENKRLEALKPKKVVKVIPKLEKPQQVVKEVKPTHVNLIQDCPDDKNCIAGKIILSNSVQVVACLNEKNMTIHQTKSGNCYLGQGGKWKNILLPPKSHIEHFKKIFGDDYKYRLAIANFEGSFNEEAKNPYAIGYLQTLRSHKVKKDIVSQLTWLKNREDKNTGVACEKYSEENFTLFGTINIEKGKLAKYTCMARRHYGAFNPGEGKHWHHSVMYAKRYKATTEYYLSLSF